ncbi:transporter substrate-binding domain-containing protein [Paraburkholderia sp. MMS20-SJTR3]|uniref:Transporter substrate-binding domain-containing protein n=1 Tax=Paraburkholderia sejongensis TaxID=2886946 RepID=A0ABS8JP25_9BURK|nr:c-type cytochrome [Paraburkholderia sp. MMS20-SJTR3]MCC8391494.1 transporter substrate-binding domain-containing protein [Paraburkholderia sp. MMS20-SJTR3]
MNIRLTHVAIVAIASALVVAHAQAHAAPRAANQAAARADTGTQSASAAPDLSSVRVCTLPGSPSAELDKAVARAVLSTAGITARFAKRGIDDDGGDDGISAHELSQSLQRDCDVIAGFPRSSVADGSDSQLLFSSGYLHSGYVTVRLRGTRAAAASVAEADGKVTIAATWSSPAQLIAVQQKDARFDLETSSELTVDALAKGRAQRAIVWYPAVVAYRRAHPQHQFDVALAVSPYADWNLVFASGPGTQALQQRIDAALTTLRDDGRLAALTRNWMLPAGTSAGAALPASPANAANAASRHAALAVAVARSPARYLDGPRAPSPRAGFMRASGTSTGGGFIKVAASSGGPAPSFDRDQVAHGEHLYADSCAKCHGEKLEGITAPALNGPSFAPAANSHLTIGGIYQYMSTNMPADKPGKMSDEEYADLMAFLLYTNGYDTGDAKLTAQAAQTSKTPLNAGPRH